MCVKGIPVPVYQDEGELNRLRGVVRDLRPARILEIGSLFGGTLWAWMHDSPGSLVVSVDTGVQTFDYRYEDIQAAKRFWPVWEQTTGCKLVQIGRDSTDELTVALIRELGPFDFIFVDGGHTYEVVSADVRNYWPMLAPGGVMALHDIAYPEDNPVRYAVGRVWREVRENAGAWTEFIRENNAEGIWGIGVMWK